MLYHGNYCKALALPEIRDPYSLDGRNARMGQARSLDSLSSEWGWPCTRRKI